MYSQLYLEVILHCGGMSLSLGRVEVEIDLGPVTMIVVELTSFRI